MQEKIHPSFYLLIVIITWYTGCTKIQDLTRNKVINPSTNLPEYTQKQNLTWETPTIGFIFVGMVGLSAFFLTGMKD